MNKLLILDATTGDALTVEFNPSKFTAERAFEMAVDGGCLTGHSVEWFDWNGNMKNILIN